MRDHDARIRRCGQGGTMRTPVADFVRNYADSGTVRMHMPGHKGKCNLGFEAMDITEIAGADSLYEADGILAESESNAADLFGSARSVYSTEGSSQCIRAMLYLATVFRKPDQGNVVWAARNVHKAFVYAAALVGFEVDWLWPEGESNSLCACPISSDVLEQKLKTSETIPAAVYVTSPDYLGGVQEISALAKLCHRYGTLLLVDNAHGAYLHFLEQPMHPIDLGADLVCDSAHKTLPVLTGGAYLHIGKTAPAIMSEQAKHAMALFGSTSPSYLILASLDECNRFLADHARDAFARTISSLNVCIADLEQKGWTIQRGEPMKLTIETSRSGLPGTEAAKQLREQGIECEFADRDFLVLMPSAATAEADLQKVAKVFPACISDRVESERVGIARPIQVMSIRQACLAPYERIGIDFADGRICAVPTVSCPPAIPVVEPGECIDRKTIDLLRYYGVEEVEVTIEN